MPQRIILDTDLAMGAPGSDIDDGFALALAHADPEIDLELITTVNGNTDVESATLLTLELIKRLGITDVPVIKGAATPLTHPERRRGALPEVTENYGIGLQPSPGYAPAAIADLVMSNPGEITIVAIGPLTNIAAAIALEPRLPAAVKELVMMGGIFLGTMTHRAMPGEFNVWVDPEAAAAVLRCGAPQRWVGLDVTLQVRLTREHAARLSAADGAFSQLAGEATRAWIDHIHARNPGRAIDADSCAMHDPLAVAALTRPELLTWRDASVEVVTGDGVARGVMVSDLLEGATPPLPNATIATAVDVDGFTKHFLGSIERL
jgi:purine nucleosidase